MSFIKTIRYFNSHRTIKFAVEELRRLTRKTGAETDIRYDSNPVSTSGSGDFLIMLEEEYNQSSFCPKRFQLKKDGFALLKDEGNTWLIGKSERAVLYAVYHFCEQELGYQWTGLHEQLGRPVTPIKRRYGIQEPRFSRRGNIVETINDPAYICSLIDWGAKNGLNEFFFTFFLWDKIKPYVGGELAKRSMEVTLGGHSLAYLLKETDETGPKEQTPGFFMGDSRLQNLVIRRIIDICASEPVISRISLWPEDIGLDEKQFADFMGTYIAFIEKLKTGLKERNLNVEVEHIVYNAGLAWHMLERGTELNASDQVDVLYAYWGRDYSQPVHSSKPDQARAARSLADWREQTSRQGQAFTVLEYYSDHFMLSELFPPLPARIHQDLLDYEEKNVDGILNLIVPYHKKQPHSTMADNYPWKWISQLNNYFYAGLSWGKDLDLLLDNYFSSLGENGGYFRFVVLELEQLVSRHTEWNVPLFPARVVDPEQVGDEAEVEKIVELLEEIADFIADQRRKIDESLLDIQHKDNYSSFSPEEMMLFYFYYVKKVADDCKREWIKKKRETSERA